MSAWGTSIRGVRSSVPVKTGPSSNAKSQRAALKRRSEFELTCGITLEAFLADQAAQRERVRARYGLTERAA